MGNGANKIRLRMLGLPVIDSLDDFSALTRLSKRMLYRCSKHSDRYYKVYSIAKKSGGAREIAQPSRTMKALQSWILRNILQDLEVSSACRGFRRKQNIKDNAEPHKGAVAVASLDIEDFFPSVHANWVCSVFKAIGYSPRIAAILASICTFQDRLPQGGPCSPALANLVCLRLDARLKGYVSMRGIIYTRYADDLTFSACGSPRLQKALPTIRAIVQDAGFQLNSQKERFRGPSSRRKVTGLVLAENEVGIGREKLRFLRAKLHHLATGKNAPAAGVAHCQGWLAFVRSVDTRRWDMLNKYMAALKEKYPDSAISQLC